MKLVKSNRMDQQILFNEFALYTTYTIETALEDSEGHLVGDDGDVRLSTSEKAASKVASWIPYVGKAASSGVEYLSGWRKRLRDKNRAYRIIDMIHLFENDRDAFRRLLVEAAFEIYFAYNLQFTSVTTRAGPLRAMQKLGLDGGARFLHSVWENVPEILNSVTDIGFVCTCIVKGKSERRSLKPWAFGKQLIISRTGETITTAEFFEEVGICAHEDGTSKCYTKNSGITRDLGHRTLLPFESIDQLTCEYTVDRCACLHQHREINVEDRRSYVENALRLIGKQTPHGDVKQCVLSCFEDLRQSMTTNADYLAANLLDTIVEVYEAKEEIARKENREIMDMMAASRRQCFLRVPSARYAVRSFRSPRGIPVH